MVQWISTLALPTSSGIDFLPEKATVIRLRWPLVLFCSYFLIYSEGNSLLPFKAYSLILFYLFSNGTLYLLEDKLFQRAYFYVPLVLFDTIFLIAAAAISGQVSTDFYLAMFLTIGLCCIARDIQGLLTVVFLGSLVYGYLLFQFQSVHDPILYLRVPFPFIVSIFYGYFAQTEFVQSRLKHQLKEIELKYQADHSHSEPPAAESFHNRELQEQLRVMVMEMEGANKVQERFLSMMTHELRTPLSAVMGYAALIEDRQLGEINGEQKNALNKVLKNSMELTDRIGSILTVAQIKSGGMKPKCQEFSGAELMENLKASFDYPLDKNVDLSWKYSRSLPFMKSDPGMMRSILQNLVGNALKFTDGGLVRISARYLRHSDEMEFQVCDTGIGISEEALPFIFEMFYQVDRSETRPYGGTGLGLYIVKNLTKALGGKIQVESKLGYGSAFTVKVPRDFSFERQAMGL